MWDGASTAVSVSVCAPCVDSRQDNLAEDSSRLPSEGGSGVAAAGSEFVGQKERAG